MSIDEYADFIGIPDDDRSNKIQIKLVAIQQLLTNVDVKRNSKISKEVKVINNSVKRLIPLIKEEF